MQSQEQRTWTPEEVAGNLNLSVRALRRIVEERDVDVVRLGERTWRLTRDNLLAILDGNEDKVNAIFGGE